MPGISFGLQEAGNHTNMPYSHRASLMLEADELPVVSGQAVCVLLLFPPALLSRILSEREQERAAGSGDLVVVEQSFDFPRLQAGPGPLVSADLGGRPFQCRGDRVS